VGGDGRPLAQYTNLTAPVTRGVLTGMINAAVTDNINFTGDVNWGRVESSSYSGGYTAQPIIIPTLPSGLQPDHRIRGAEHHRQYDPGAQLRRRSFCRVCADHPLHHHSECLRATWRRTTATRHSQCHQQWLRRPQQGLD
jgi:hypothetical protein